MNPSHTRDGRNFPRYHPLWSLAWPACSDAALRLDRLTR